METKTTVENTIAAYKDALNMEDENRTDLMRSIEADLEALGVTAVVAGKKALIYFHEDKIAEILDSRIPGEELNDDQQNKFDISTGCIAILESQINELLGVVDYQKDDAQAELEFTLAHNETISSGELLTASVRTTIGTKVTISKEYAVSLKACSDSVVILTKDEIEEILSILNEYRPL